MNNFYGSYGAAGWIHAGGVVLSLIVLWSIFWKGLALWHSGRRNQGWWFVVMLIVNTVGILEIIYLFGVCRLKFSELFSKK
jgi:hypothetical protein